MGQGFIWDEFFTMIEKLAVKVPYMVGIGKMRARIRDSKHDTCLIFIYLGNHEYGYTRGNTSKDHSLVANDTLYLPPWSDYAHDSDGECAIPVYHRFQMPQDGLPPYYYSFDYGNVHILMISSEHNFSYGAPQYQWMETDLQAVNRTRTPFLVVTSHRPMYASEIWPSRYQMTKNQRDAYENLVS